MTEVTVLGQDPRFGGGAHAQMTAFWTAVQSIGLTPELVYLEHPSLAGLRPSAPLDFAGVRPPFAHADALNQLWGARKLASRASRATSLWVVATTAQYGAAAMRSGRPYRCWVGTTLAAEHRARRSGLKRSRRLAAAVNAPVLRLLERQTIRSAEAVYATSPYSRERVAEVGEIEAEAVGILSLPVNADLFSPESDDKWLARLENPSLVFVGRTDDPRKNLDLAKAALPLIRKRLPTATLRVVGPGAVAPIEGLIPRGVVASVADEVRTASLMVMPSREEGFGIAAAEALAAGVPVLATPCGGPEAMLEESGGGVVTNGWTPEEFASQAVQLLHDPVRLLERRRSGRRYVVEIHSPERFRVALQSALNGTLIP